MQFITIHNGQTLVDLAMQHAGSAEAALAMCLQNNVPITQSFEAGNTLLQPSVVNKFIVQLFAVEKVQPKSNTNQAVNNLAYEGISYWQLENDFIIQ